MNCHCFSAHIAIREVAHNTFSCTRMILDLLACKNSGYVRREEKASDIFGDKQILDYCSQAYERAMLAYNDLWFACT